MREPKVENKYNLMISDISKLRVVDRERIREPIFWRNNVIEAWCISDSVKPNKKDVYGTFDLGYWIGIYDDNAKSYKGEIRLKCSSYGGMCSYDFKEFFNPKEIEDEYDLILQERLLEKINWLIDEGILCIA